MAENTRNTKSQELFKNAQFRNAANANGMQRAGEGPESQSARVVPGERLTGAQAEAEVGRPADQGANKNASDGNYDPARAGQPGGAEAEALKVQHSGEAAEDTDSDMPDGDQIRARVEGIVDTNPG